MEEAYRFSAENGWILQKHGLIIILSKMRKTKKKKNKTGEAGYGRQDLTRAVCLRIIYRIMSVKPGLVLVSTGVLKLEKPSAGRDRAVNRNLKINADNNKLAYAA